MSDYINFDLQVKILKNLPVKSLIQFRSVSKSWKSLIDSSKFIADYTRQNQQQQQPLLLVRYSYQSDDKYVSILDDDNFQQCNISTISPPKSDNVSLEYSSIVGSSHGLFCLYVHRYKHYKTDMAVIWNPSIRKSVTINVPNDSKFTYENVVAFGVSPITFDPMIVNIEHLNSSWLIKVFTLSSRDWKTLCTDLPRESVVFMDSYVDIHGFIYWHAYERYKATPLRSNNLILSFDMTSHQFRELYLPDSLAHSHHTGLSVSKVRDSLLVLQYDVDVSSRHAYAVWMMMDRQGVPNLFTKLYTIVKPIDVLSIREVLGFTNTGAPITEMKKDDDEDNSSIAVYETDSQHFNETGVYGDEGSFSVNSYMKTLLLLDLPDSVSLLGEVGC